MATYNQQQTRAPTRGGGIRSWSRNRWLVVGVILVAIIVAILVILTMGGGGSGGGGSSWG